MLPRVSIITVVYNAAADLRLTLENLLQIKYENLELIVVDGGSTDGTRTVIEEFSLHIAHWVSEPDDGIYDAMNKGLRMSSGDYVWFVNAGDYAYDSHVLENIFKGAICLCILRRDSRSRRLRRGERVETEEVAREVDMAQSAQGDGGVSPVFYSRTRHRSHV